MRILNWKISEEFFELQNVSKIYRHKNRNLGEDRFFPENGNSISEFPIRVKLYNLCFLVKLPCSLATPNTLGHDGPQRSISRTPTFIFSSEFANALANIAVSVDLPTPPFPDKIRILRLTFFKRSAIT